MDAEFQRDCIHCQLGCDHPHDHNGTIVVAQALPSVMGSRMRHGGSWSCPHGLTLASDEWVPLRCRYCRQESMTPVEAFAPFGPQINREGVVVVTCGLCTNDLRAGHKPGHSARSARRRRR